MAHGDHVSLIKKGAEIWHQWRKDNSGVQPDLYAAKLKGSVCTGMDLSGPLFSVAILNRATSVGRILGRPI